MSRLLACCCILIGLSWAAVWPGQAGAAAPAAEVAAVLAARLLPGEHIVLDGRLAHPAWQRAPAHRDFVEKFPDTGAQPIHRTEVQVLFDEDALYVGIRAFDPRPEQIRAPLVRHDQVNRTQDFVAVYIDAIGNRQSAQFFRVNAAGSKGDGMLTAADDSEDFAPDFDFDAAAARDEQGYTAVLRIPFAALRFSGEGRPNWRFMVVRRVPREQFYLHSSVLIPRDAPNFIANLQALQGIALPERHQFLSLRPSVTLRRSSDQLPGQPVRGQSELTASLDVKWRPRSEWVIDGTLRPDFSQVALDVPKLTGNTRYALSLPEKRPFFFESSDLLRSPTEALYTRSFTEPRWGLRSTWRGLNLAGTAFAIDDHGGGQVLIPAAWGTGVAEQPASRALAGRAGYDFGALQLGALAMARDYADGRGSNQVLGPDLGWQIDPAWRLRGQWLQSHSTALPAASGALQRGPAQRGQRALLKALYQGNLVEGNVFADDIDAGFRNDTGFVYQSGVRSVGLWHARGWQRVGPFNEFWVNFKLDQTEDKTSGQRVSRDWAPGIWLTGAHNLEWSLGWHGDSQLRTAPGAPLLSQRYWRSELTVTPAEWIPLLRMSGRAGRVADVQANALRQGGDLSASLTTRPLSRLELEPRWDVAWLHNAGRLSYRESAAQVLAVWHLDARQTLRAIVQRTAFDRQGEPGVAAARDGGTVGSLTWAWRRSSGQVLYVGANRSRHGLSAVSRSNEVFVKLQFDLDEVRAAF